MVGAETAADAMVGILALAGLIIVGRCLWDAVRELRKVSRKLRRHHPGREEG